MSTSPEHSATAPAATPAADLHRPVHRDHLSAAAFRDPVTTDRPGFRWWWPQPTPVGELIEELRAIHEAGFGEVEIGFSPGFWADDAQREALHAVLTEAERLGVGVATTLGAAWPLQTPTTTRGTEYAAKELQYGVAYLSDGEPLTQPPRPFDDDPERPGELVALVVGRVLERGDAPSVVPSGNPFGDPTRIAPPERPTVLDESTLAVVEEPDGWTAPEGEWAAIALWSRDCAQGVTSFLDARAARAAAEYLDEHQIGDANQTLLRTTGTELFEDSLELNADCLFWTADFLDRFREHAGYDPTALLPLAMTQGMCRYWVPGEETTADFVAASDLGRRVRADYDRVVTDLYVSDHLALLQEWSAEHGLRHKSQAAYGQNLEPVRSFRELVRCGGRAEGESLNSGDRAPMSRDHFSWRFALDWQRSVVGGSHQGGTTRVSTELGAQFGAAFRYSLLDYCQLLDKEWAAGITKPYVHGFAAQDPEAPWPTRSRFGNLVAQSWNHRHFPQWEHWRALTDYWARGTAVLETGAPRTDVAVHRDGFLTTAARGSAEQDLTTPGRLADLEPLERAGYSSQFLDPVGLAEPGALGALDGGPVLFADGPAYRALVIDERALTPGAARAAADAAEAGLAVVVVGEAPDADSGWGGVDRTSEVREAVSRLLAAPSCGRADDMAGVPAALEALGVVPRVAVTGEPSGGAGTAGASDGPILLSQLRRTERSSYVLLYNTESVPVRATGSLEGEGLLRLMDLETGAVTPLDAVEAPAGRTGVDLEIEPLGVVVLQLRAEDERGRAEQAALGGPVPRTMVPTGTAEPVELPLTEWSLEVLSEEPGGARRIELPGQGPADWRDVPALARVAGTGTYSTVVAVPPGAEGAALALDLGVLAGSARVTVEGSEAAPVALGGRRVDLGVVTAEQAGSDLALRVEVRTALTNAVDLASLPGDGFIPPEALAGIMAAMGVSSAPAPAGLIGPVRVLLLPPGA